MQIRLTFALLAFIVSSLSPNLSAQEDKKNETESPTVIGKQEPEKTIIEPKKDQPKISLEEEKNRLFRKDVILLTNEILEKVQKNYPNLAEKLSSENKEEILQSVVSTLNSGLEYCPAGTIKDSNAKNNSDKKAYPAIIIAAQRVLYARLDAFTPKILKQLEEDFTSSFRLANPPSGLILDLRSAEGYQVKEVLETLGLFVDEAKIPLTPGLKPFDLCVKTPVLILIGEKTVGAPELFTLLLTKLGKAMPIGEKTAGKPFIKNKIPLSNGDFLLIPQVPRYLSFVNPEAVEPAIKTTAYPQIEYPKLRGEAGSETSDQTLQRAIELIICLQALTPGNNQK